MTDKRIIYQNAEGGVSIVTPAPGGRLVFRARDATASMAADTALAALIKAEGEYRLAEEAAERQPDDVGLGGNVAVMRMRLSKVKATADKAVALVWLDIPPNGMCRDVLERAADKRGLAIQIVDEEHEVGWIERVKRRSVPKDAEHIHVVNAADIPKDRTNRDNWKTNGAGIIT